MISPVTAEFHAQTAIEAASMVRQRLLSKGRAPADIKSIVNRTNEACVRIIDKQFKPLDNYADRDHCVQVKRFSPDDLHF